MEVSMNRATPSHHHPFTDGIFPSENIQLLGYHNDYGNPLQAGFEHCSVRKCKGSLAPQRRHRLLRRPWKRRLLRMDYLQENPQEYKFWETKRCLEENICNLLVFRNMCSLERVSRLSSIFRMSSKYQLGVSINGGTWKWMVYKGKSY